MAYRKSSRGKARRKSSRGKKRGSTKRISKITVQRGGIRL